jgi:hypothetical protein
MSLAADLIPNPGQAFEDWYPDVVYATFEQVNAVTGAATTSVENVAAAKLVEAAAMEEAGGGQVGQGSVTWWFRCDLLGVTPKPKDRLILNADADSEEEWILDDCEFAGVGGVNYLCRSKCTRKR